MATGATRDEAPPEINLIAVSHYLQALDAQRKANQAVAILGGKTPHIQNLAVGGVANAINLDDPATLNMEKIYMVKDLLAEVTAFVQQVYLPDVCVIGAKYAEWLKYGAGSPTTSRCRTSPSTPRGRSSTSPGDDLRWEARDVQADLVLPRIRTSRRTCRRASPVLLRRGVGETPVEEATVPKAGEFIPSGSTRGRSPAFQGRPMQVGPSPRS